MNTQMTTLEDQAAIMESVMLGGDLSKLTPSQRVSYYRSVCESIGVNYLTKPFDYIWLNKKDGDKWIKVLTLYAKKDCTDQLRKINSVSIIDVNIVETEKQFIVKVKGQDKEGRQDVEIGVVNKGDMRGDSANEKMKAVTKAKRRLTLSLCGLGWLDETEVQTIPDAIPSTVDPSTGEIIGSVPDENRNQETGEDTPPIEIISVMGDWAVGEAATYWNISKEDAAKQIGKKWHGKMDKREFLDLLKGAPA